MQVSFGKTYVFNEEGTRPQGVQKVVCDIIQDSFGIPQDPWSSRQEANTSVEKLLYDKKNADVFIKNRKDGNISVEVRELTNFNLHYNDDDDFLKVLPNDGFIPYDSRGKQKLKITLDLSKPNTLIRKIKSFTDKCRDFAIYPECKRNFELSADYQSKTVKEAIKRGLVPKEYL